eukprot:14312076-Ditylum_brightwellii.AAC.2
MAYTLRSNCVFTCVFCVIPTSVIRDQPSRRVKKISGYREFNFLCPLDPPRVASSTVIYRKSIDLVVQKYRT